MSVLFYILIYIYLGGKNALPTAAQAYIPSTRLLLYIMTLLINAWYAYNSYTPDLSLRGNPDVSEFFSGDFWGSLVTSLQEVEIVYVARVRCVTLTLARAHFYTH